MTRTASPRERLITTVRSRGDLRAFVEWPYTRYAGDPHWVPPLRRDEHRRWSDAHNPFWQHAERQLWLARIGDAVIGRIAAIEDRRYNDTHGGRTAWFGFFEAGDAGTAADLLRAVERWAAERGATVVRGPVNPSLNESAGLLVDGFDDDPFILMPYNPPAYAAYITAAGYTKAKDLLAWQIDLTSTLPERVVRLANRVRKRPDLVVRTVDLAHFDRDVAIVQEIYRKAWQDNWGFVAPTEAEVRQTAAELRPIVDPEAVVFVEMAGQPVACVVGLPDVNQVLKRMRGRLLPFGWWHFLRRRAIIDRGRTLLLGVVPEARRIGLYPLLVAEIFTRGVARGYRSAELSWTLEDNDAINAGIAAAGGRHAKTYRVYEKTIPGSDRGLTPV